MTAQDDAGPLLQTKLYLPRPRRGQVGRPRLLERLRRGADSKLTLLSAPAGFGKTTLLAEWLDDPSRRRDSTAWLSLDPSDSQALPFWSYVIAALQTVAPGVGATRSRCCGSRNHRLIELVLAPLVNELSTTSHQIVLVLDDYHVIDAHDVHHGMAFLLEHLPPQIHVVIATRADPPLPLARLRGRAELVEIRAADLRFTPDEALAYLNEVMDLDLTAQRCRRAGRPDRRLDRRAATGGVVHPGTGRRGRLHRGLCRGRPLHRRLPGRRGPAASA